MEHRLKIEDVQEWINNGFNRGVIVLVDEDGSEYAIMGLNVSDREARELLGRLYQATVRMNQ